MPFLTCLTAAKSEWQQIESDGYSFHFFFETPKINIYLWNASNSVFSSYLFWEDLENNRRFSKYTLWRIDRWARMAVRRWWKRRNHRLSRLPFTASGMVRWCCPSPWVAFNSTVFNIDSLLSYFNPCRQHSDCCGSLSDEIEERSISFDSLGEEVLDFHQFEASVGDATDGPNHHLYPKQSRTFSLKAAVPIRRQLSTIDRRSNIPPPRGKTMKTLRYYRIYSSV